VGVLVGAVEREVAQGGEYRFDPVQPEPWVGRKTSSTSAGGPRRTAACCCGEKLSSTTYSFSPGFAGVSVGRQGLDVRAGKHVYLHVSPDLLGRLITVS
jgi:hypothetical protein